MGVAIFVGNSKTQRIFLSFETIKASTGFETDKWDMILYFSWVGQHLKLKEISSRLSHHKKIGSVSCTLIFGRFH